MRFKILLALVAAWLLAGAYILYRYSEIGRLTKIALSPLSDTASADSAISQLSAYRGFWATDSLLRIATADREFIDDRQDLAIQAIAVRANPVALAQLATLLQPSNGLARREAVAKALVENACNELCAQSILHYLERYWCGQGKNEDITLLAMHSNDGEIEKEEASVADNLGKILTRNDKATLAVLDRIYGLGSPAPSAFSLHIVESLHLRRACLLVSVSKHDLIDSSKEEKLEKLFHDLRCPSELESGKD
jgi:hypothetical protein